MIVAWVPTIAIMMAAAGTASTSIALIFHAARQSGSFATMASAMFQRGNVKDGPIRSRPSATATAFWSM